MPKELELADKMQEGNLAVKYWLQGHPPTTIAKTMNIKRAQVLEYIDRWKEIAQDSEEIKDRAREVLRVTDESYDMIIKEFWESIDAIDSDHKTKGTLLKNLADIQAKRVELFRQAGVMDDEELGEQMAEVERKQEILKGILRDVSLKCPHCKEEVARRMQRMDPSHVEPITVEIKRTDDDM